MLCQQHGDEIYLKHIICNDSPAVIFLVLKAKFRVETKAHDKSHMCGVLRMTMSD